MTNEEAQKVLKELEEVRPEKLNDEAKRLFEAIMKIADERDLLKEKTEKQDKIINEMADEMADIDYDYMCGNWCGNETGCDGEERATCIKKYFSKKVGE